MLPDRAAELETFKTAINLTEYLAAQGYEIDRQKSSRHCVVMKGQGDKLVIGVDAHDRHWIYFSVRDPGDNGSIIDFVQKHQGGPSLGDVRKRLRPWLGDSLHPPPRPTKDHYAEALEPSSRDTARVVAEYEAMQPIIDHHAYLERERCIPPAVLADPRFAGKIRTDQHRNAVFPHFNASGLCGYEKKNRGFTGFASGGAKGLWASAANSEDTTLVITESAIDALSYHALHYPSHARYISIGGSMNPEQPDLIQRAVGKLPAGGQVVIATDHDDGGDQLADQLQAIVEDAGRPDIAVRVHRPAVRGQDWNDVLKAQQQAPTTRRAYGR